MQQTGFSLVANGAEVSRHSSIPEPFILPDGDAVHGLSAGVPFQAGMFVPRYLIDTPVQWCSRTGETVDVQAGQVVVTNVYSATPDQCPQIISARQFFQQLAVQAVITQDEMLAAIGPGTLPATLANLVAGLPVGDGTAADPNNQQFSAKALLVGATQFERGHPMTAVLIQAFGKDAAWGDALWRSAWAL